MKISKVAKSYAKAIFIQSKQRGLHLEALAELTKVSKIILEEPTAINFFSNPLIGHEKKMSIIKEVIAAGKISDDIASLLILMGEKDRLSEVANVVDCFQGFIDNEEGVSRGVVRSAQVLTSEAQTQIELKINQTLKQKVLLTYQQDPNLLGGVVVQVGGWSFDDSIDSHLKKLNEELNRRAK